MKAIVTLNSCAAQSAALVAKCVCQVCSCPDRTQNGHKAANHKHQASQKSDAEAKESKPAANRRSSDAGAKKAAANGQAAAKQQKDIKPEKQPANKAAGAAAKKSSAVKTEKAAATNAAAKQQRVKKEFDLPGQTRETPDEVSGVQLKSSCNNTCCTILQQALEVEVCPSQFKKQQSFPRARVQVCNLLPGACIAFLV